jgi:hypothetical protein
MLVLMELSIYFLLRVLSYSQDLEIIAEIEELEGIKYMSELVARGAFDIRKGVSVLQ